jgi:aspartate aminotransferase
MKVSERVAALSPSATLAVSARVKELRAKGVDVIGFGAGEPDFDTPQHIRQAAIDALLEGETHYQPTPGVFETRVAIADKLRRENGVECRPEDVVITVGGKHALYEIFQCLVDPGAEVIVPTPAWVSYAPMIRLAGGTVVEVPSSVDTDFKITPDQLEAAITDRTVAMVINSPSNPCGTMYSPDELRELADVLERHPHVWIISDEIYERLIFGGIDHLSLGSHTPVADRVITVNGLSKAFAMTGWRIGYLAAPGHDGMIARAVAKLQSQMTSNITSFVYTAIVDALENSDDDIEQMRQTFAKRAELIYGLIGKWPDVRCPKPTGAFYVFPDIGAYFGRTSQGGTRMTNSVEFAAAMLEEAKVAVVPGDDFGECARPHVRLSFAASDEQITEGCRRIEEWLKSLR